MAEKDLTARPLALGDVLDRALTLTRRHFKVLFVVTLAFEVPVYGVSRVVLLGTKEMLASVGENGAAAQAAARTVLLQMGGVATLLFFIQSCISASLAAAAAP